MLRTDLIAPIAELLRRHADARGAKVAFQDGRRSVTYADLLERTGRLAGHLADLGVAPGQSVAILLPNSVDWVEACFAIARAGAVSVPISYEASEPEILYRLTDADCRAIITTDERAELAARLRSEASGLASTILSDRGAQRGDGLRFASLARSTPRSSPRDPSNIDEPAFIIYTSGTTGRAKGVLLTMRGMLWVTAACWAPICSLSHKDTVLSPLPLFHSYALNLSVLSILATGASEYIMERFSTAEALALLKSGAYTLMPGVPTMFHYLLQRAREDESKASSSRSFFSRAKPKAADAKLPSLRMCISAGAIMPATLNREFEEFFSVPLLDGYGITETSTMVTMNWPTGGRVLGSCGIPVPGLAVRIIDPATGHDAPLGAEGELIVRGPNVMPGYHNKPAETEAALRDGWYRTGDLARSDANGFLTITGRLKELIIRGGQNIAPAEIEEAVNKFAPVLDSAVVGVPHQHLGEVPALFVVARPGMTIDAEALLGHCAAQLSAYKVPQSVHVVGEIPRTGSGKIIRFKLREMLTSQNQ
ncbi:MAG: acyl--CoA ligase [Hyphomicrobiaceae bacterium]|nr:MAG: acyl--CoA ligase [Hyphomicrobiaceae bacterium]